MPARNSPRFCVRLIAVWAASPGARSFGNTKSCANGADTTMSSKPIPASSAAVPSGSPC